MAEAKRPPFAEVLEEFGATGLAGLTEAEWAERDRKLRATQDKIAANDSALLADAAILALRSCGAPERRLSEATGLGFNARAPAVEQVTNFDPEADRPIRILAGSVGVGKTIAALRWLVDHGGDRPLFLRANAFEAAGRYDKVLRARWESATSLLLDDLGSEFADGKGNLAADLQELVDFYAGGAAGLIITTNLAWREFEQRYGERIWSRLRQGARWRNVKGPDLRRSK